MSAGAGAASGISAPPGPRIGFAETEAELAAVVALRRHVFRDEQGIVDADVTDADDGRSLQAVAYHDDEVVGVGRLTPPPPDRIDAQIAWVATRPDRRGRGVGSAVVRALLKAADDAEIPVVVLNAQTHALAFYRRLGFVPFGRRFMVRGIEHQLMTRRRST